MYRFLLPILALLLWSSCSTSTYIVSSWTNPADKAQNGQLNKIMVISLVKDEETRKKAEDYLAAKNPSFSVSYDKFSSRSVMEDQTGCRRIMKSEGFDGVLTLRLIDEKEEEFYEPGEISEGYWGYHNIFYPGFYDPDYFKENTKYIIETSVFSLKNNKLLWMGKTSTTNPGSIEKTVKQVMTEVRKQMVLDGFIIDNN